MVKKRISILLALGLAITTAMSGCGSGSSTKAQASVTEKTDEAEGQTESQEESSGFVWDDELTDYAGKPIGKTSSYSIDPSEIFSDRDLRQEADLEGAKTIVVSDNADVSITEEGVYVITGTASECTIRVEAAKDAKVQLVLDSLSITNSDSPAIYVVTADKVFVTTTKSENMLKVTGEFTEDGDTNTDAVIFSKDDLVLNGLGKLTIVSSENGISGKDDLKITGGTYDITSTKDAIEANDSIAVSDGTFAIKSSKDGLHSENDDDQTKGYIYIGGGNFEITADGDAVQATTLLEIAGGTLKISGREGLEATYVLINDGTISIEASDDGINASNKSASYSPTVEINGGSLTIVMGSGDTDAIDANGSIFIKGGTVDITAWLAFDFDLYGEISGGTVTVNGEQVTRMTNSMMGGRGVMRGSR